MRNDDDLKSWGKIICWGTPVPSETKGACAYLVSLMNKSRVSWMLFCLLVICMDLKNNT